MTEQFYKTKSFKDFRVLSPKELIEFRENLLNSQNYKCAICNKDISEKSHLDHQHTLKSEILGENGAGLIRALLCPNCNNYLGKIENNAKRFSIFNLPEILRKIADYLEQPNIDVLHSSEKRFEKISKSDFNKIVKLSGLKLKYPYKGKITKQLKELKEKYLIKL